MGKAWPQIFFKKGRKEGLVPWDIYGTSRLPDGSHGAPFDSLALTQLCHTWLHFTVCTSSHSEQTSAIKKALLNN